MMRYHAQEERRSKHSFPNAAERIAKLAHIDRELTMGYLRIRRMVTEFRQFGGFYMLPLVFLYLMRYNSCSKTDSQQQDMQVEIPFLATKIPQLNFR